MYEQEQKYTLEEYWEIVKLNPDHKYEYVDGRIRLMTGGSPAHGQIAMRIGMLLGVALDASECNVYSSDVAIRVWEKRYYYPDLSVSCDPVDWTQKKALESPTVVVEVLSPATEKWDRGEKLQGYQHLPTIREIVYVDSRKRYVEQYHRTGSHDWKFSVYEQDDDVIALSDIDVRLAVRDIYAKVYLEGEDFSRAD